MGLRRLGSLSFRDNLTMAGVVQFHAKLLTQGDKLEKLTFIEYLELELSCFLHSSANKQALRTACELLRRIKELHASSCNCMQAYVTACKLM